MKKLGDSIRKLQQGLSATPRQYQELQQGFVPFLRSEIQPRVGATSVAAFGSCSNGLWTNASDADLTLIVPRCNTKLKILTKLKVIREYIWKLDKKLGVDSIELVEHARIPVLKLKLLPSCLTREIDLSINNISGVENSLLVHQWTRLDPRFVPIAMAIKHWAKTRNINDRAKGTLSTYTLLLQLVYVMQKHSMLPRFSHFGNTALLEEPFEELNGMMRETPFDVSHAFSSQSEISVPELFILFFQTFGDPAFANGAEIVDGDITAQPTASGALIMRCPLTNKDVNVMTASAWKSIHAEFACARDLLESDADLDVIMKPIPR